MKILLVSEDDDLLYVLCYGLRHRGYEAISTILGEHMSRLLQTEQPSLLIVDDVGLGRAGVFALTEFRAARIPCILLTSHSDHLAAWVGHRWDVVLPKSFQFKDLVRAIASIGGPLDGEATDGPELPGERNLN